MRNLKISTVLAVVLALGLTAVHFDDLPYVKGDEGAGIFPTIPTIPTFPTNSLGAPEMHLVISGAGVSCLGDIGSMTCSADPGTQFSVAIKGTVADASTIGGYQAEISFGGLPNTNKTCTVMNDMTPEFLCLGPTNGVWGQVNVGNTNGLLPPLPGWTNMPDVARFPNAACPQTGGQFEIVITAAIGPGQPASPLGSKFKTTTGGEVLLKVRGTALFDPDGVGGADTEWAVADKLTMSCGPLAPTATPCPPGKVPAGAGCGTPTPTRTPTPTITPTGTLTPTATRTPCTVGAQIDTDCDFMPDKFELAYSCLHVLQPDAGADPDFDGKANILEFAKGSNPCSGDTDGDSNPDGIDSCQLLPEDYDGVMDADGCPDYDNDSDGLCDGHFGPAAPGGASCVIPALPSPRYVPPFPGGPAPDRCSNVSEDYDAFKDLDGCPEPDNDEDGFPDTIDDCPATDFTAGPDGVADSGDEPIVLAVPIRTREDYDGVLDNDGCHDSPGEDYDGDGISDDDEEFIYGSDPADTDTDKDGCKDGREVLVTDPVIGGQRNPTNFWDFYDTPDKSGVRNRTVDIDDVVRVASRFANVGNASVDPLLPPPPNGYHSAYDRTFSGPYVWSLGPADGRIIIDDVLFVLYQFAHTCA